MPVFLEPDQSFPIVLDCDKDKPKESQPTFLVKSQSMRGQREVLRVLDAATDAANESLTVDEMFEMTITMLCKVMVGWHNMGDHKFSREAIADLEALAPIIQERILRKVRWLSDNFENVSLQALSANLSGLFKLRVDDYRVIVISIKIENINPRVFKDFVGLDCITLI
jgi:mRNA-degrading endonuclease RelE of RelBE toxin-antitoxin system